MKSDLNCLMEARGLSAIYIPGADVQPVTCRLNGIDIHYASVLQKRGGQPVLFVGPMERQEAAKTGLHFIRSTNSAGRTSSRRQRATATPSNT